MNYKKYVTVDGDYPALIAFKEWGNASLVFALFSANPDAFMTLPLSAGIELDIPILEETAIADDLPPWKTDIPDEEDDPTDPGDNGGPVKPPPPQLLFYPGFPRVSDNGFGHKLEFAITQTRVEAFQVERLNGAIIYSSPGHNFSAGYPVSTPDIPDGDLYRVKIGSLVSGYFPVMGFQNPLRFSSMPAFILEAGVKKIKWAPAFAGSYLVRLLKADGTVVSSTQKTLVIDKQEVFTVTEDGNYVVWVGPLSATVAVFEDVELEIETLAITNDVNSRDTTFYTKSSVLMDMKIDMMDGSAFQGITEPNGPVTNGQWIPGTTQWAGVNFDQVFRYNPLSVGVGGLIPGKTIKMSFREKDTTEPIIEKIYTLPVTTTQYPPVEIPLEDGSVGEDCELGPFVNSMKAWSKEMVSWNMDGSGIKELRLYVQDTATDDIVVTKDVDFVKVVNGVEVPVFSPSYRAIVFFDEDLEPGIYRIGTEGLNCDSPIYWGPNFEIEDDGPVDPGPDPGEQSGDYIVRVATFPFPGEAKFQMTAMEDGLGMVVTDLVSSSKNANVNIWYMVNEAPRIVDRLIGMEWRFPGPLSIRKIRLENWITEPIQTGGETAWTPVRGIQFFENNGAYAQFDAVAVKQNV